MAGKAGVNAKKSKVKKVVPPDDRDRRQMVSQSLLPRHTLDDALRIARAISENYGKQPTRPLRVAQALNVAPTTGSFKTLASASEAYGLTDGGAQADTISLTALGRRVVAPTKEGDDVAARREAFLKPTIIGNFLRKYDGSRFPDARIAANVLEELGLPGDATERAVSVIRKGAESLGFLVEGKNGAYVDLRGTVIPAAGATDDDDDTDDELTPVEEEPEAEPAQPEEKVVPVTLTVNRRVYITHGSNKGIVSQLKDMVTYGELTPVVSEERETPALSISDRVLNDMRSCGAAIVHVGTEEKLLDAEGNERAILNQNVLIEIGAALALYARRFILLVEKGVKLPSNLSGLYEVRYEGDKLDYEATMKLLKALSRLKEDEGPARA